MLVRVPFGSGMVEGEIRLAEKVEKIVPKKVKPITDIGGEINRAVAKNRRPRTDINKDSEITSSVIVAPHPKEFPGISKILNLAINSFDTIRLSGGDIRVIFAATTEIPDIQSKIIREIRNDLPSEVSTYFHRWDDTAPVTNVGSTLNAGTQIDLINSYVEADVKIAIGNVFPDIIHSVTGTPYTLVPGVCSSKTAKRMKYAGMTEDARVLDPLAPIAKDSLNGSNLHEPDFTINFLMNQIGEISSISVGKNETSWKLAVERLTMLSEVRFSKHLDVAIVGMGGGHWDSTLYDAIDGVFAGHRVTREGGVIILVAECSQGIGPEPFELALGRLDSSFNRTSIKLSDFEIGMEKIPRLKRVLESRKLMLCSRLPETRIPISCGFTITEDLQDGLNQAEGFLGIEATYGIIPYGKATVPVLESR